MKRINRRKFIQTGIAGLAGLSILKTENAFSGFTNPANVVIDKVKLGETGLMVPLLAMGTGSTARGGSSNQTRLGTQGFVKLAHHAYDRGIEFFDTADTYGSHTYVRSALKELPREKTTLLTKIWTENTTEPVPKTLDRFRMEIGTDYFDIVLMHCLMRGNWREEKKAFLDGLARAKQDGIIKAVGVSCHNWRAMEEAVDDPWVDVILARINPFGTHMDGTPEAVMGLLERARKNGKGVIGMKIFGNGDNTSEDERERSISYALKSGNVHCMTLGMESKQQIDDAVERIMRNRV
jgi:1-deoxyxylulose-5-phosphate synthase